MPARRLSAVALTDQPVIVIAGPTAGGKSGLGMDLAERLDGVIINADSMQVYRDLAILTARPTAADEARVPHCLYGDRDAAAAGSAAEWVKRAEAAIAAAFADSKRAIVVGGTGFYLKALMEGIVPIPLIPADVRTRSRSRRREIGDIAFHDELASRDPEMAARLNPGDSQRVLRAWEVVEARGRALSDWQRDPTRAPETRFRVLVVAPPREELYRNCDRRFIDMLEAGAVEEVMLLADRADAEGFDPALPILKALGYRQLLAYSRDEMSLDSAIAAAQQETRNYAKRQLTWLRHQLPNDTDPHPRIAVKQYNYVIDDELFSFMS
ncbi:MAG: tRNA (adenosine(37)-N6)-dimethylallyltransferase MiaA [Alphaproteobacteria bacterium]|nr:tRNA (adenosine(37)-N6)-dimethylallyltransferase MiaA [Alphaproteobacteria bacterium]